MDNNRVRRIDASPPPFPSRLPCFAALGIVILFFVGTVLTLFMALGFLFCFCLLWFLPDPYGGELDTEEEDVDIETGGTTNHPHNPQQILGRLFSVTKEERRRQLKNASQILLGSVVNFESQAMASSGYSVCAICLEDFQNGEECFVFPVCSHLFHSKCIFRWLEKKPTCPVCRYCVLPKAKRVNGTRNRTFLESTDLF